MSYAKVLWKRVRRAPMVRALRPLLRWAPPDALADGYSIAVGCMRSLAPVAAANMRLLARGRPGALREIMLVFDCTEAELPSQVLALHERLDWPCPVRILTYTSEQVRVARRIHWGWVYSWLSWSLAIEHCRTRHLVLHDLDALPLEPTLFDRLYQGACTAGTVFHGIRPYTGAWIGAADGLVTTFELVLQPGVLRARFQPIDAFNRAGLIGGRYVDFDTLLWIQHQVKSGSVQPLDESELVHPSQLICNYTDFVAGRGNLPRIQHNLVLLPYFEYLGGDATQLDAATAALRDPQRGTIPLSGRPLPVGHLRPAHWAWTEKQIRRVEQALYGATRPAVEAFLAGIVQRCGAARTVDREPGGVAAR